MKKITIIGALVALTAFALAFTACEGCGRSANASASPSDLAREMNNYIKEGKYDKAVRFWIENSDSKNLPDEISGAQKNELDQMVALFSDKIKEEIGKKGGISKIEIKNETISEDGLTASVIVATTYGDGTTDEEESEFVKVDGKWKFADSK